MKVVSEDGHGREMSTGREPSKIADDAEVVDGDVPFGEADNQDDSTCY